MSKTAFARKLGSGCGIQVGKKQVHIATAKKVEEIYNDVQVNGVRDNERPQIRGRGKKTLGIEQTVDIDHAVNLHGGQSGRTTS